MSVEIDVRYEGKLHCTATHGPSKSSIATDAPLDNSGKGEAFSPTDLVGAALGTCIMTILGMVAERSGIDLTGTTIRVAKEMASEPSRRIGSLTVRVAYPAGLALSDAAAAKLEKAAAFCPVKQSLHPEVAVNMEFVRQ